MKKDLIVKDLFDGVYDNKIARLMGEHNVEKQKLRYINIINETYNLFNDDKIFLFSAPGRTEIGGNHTDHQLGNVLAASVNMDIVAGVVQCDDYIEYYSDGFKIEKININDLEIKKEEYYTSESLIKGTLARFKELGYKIGGFSCYSNSEVLKGSGISSSAAFEVLVGTILSHLYNEGKIDPIDIAKIGQYAENVYFNKPCGLMDQMACSVGGFVGINFSDKDNPLVEKIDFNFNDYGYQLILVDTKGDHADLSDEYGLMKSEMVSVANALGVNVLSETTIEELMLKINDVKKETHDRAILRAIHYFNEDKRAIMEKNALKEKNINKFKKLMIDSGQSSFMYLQNIYSPTNVYVQNISMGLALSEHILRDKGAYRVHGGGLAGTIQALVPNELVDSYVELLNRFFGQNSCHIMMIRPEGGVRIL